MREHDMFDLTRVSILERIGNLSDREIQKVRDQLNRAFGPHEEPNILVNVGNSGFVMTRANAIALAETKDNTAFRKALLDIVSPPKNLEEWEGMS